DGSVLNLVWFHQPYRARQLQKGQRLIVAGEVKETRYGSLQMANPDVQPVDGRIVRVAGLTPKYHLSAGLTSKRIANWVEAALPLVSGLADPLPDEVRSRHRLLPLADAVRMGHQPAHEEEWKSARHRMQFAEIFELQASFLIV